MKHILITGCSLGFGLLAAKHLAEKGHHVYATMRNVNGKNAGKAKELEALGATNVEEINRAASFEGDNALMYTANLKLYTALKILQPFYDFEANSEDELYEGIKKINWSEYFSYIDSFKIDSTCNSEIFTHSQYVTHKVKDAIADQFKEKYDRRDYGRRYTREDS